MPNYPIRRSQLIAPFGVGAMMVVRDGVSLITAGLDHWYEREDGVLADTTEFKVEEWRLSRQLGVNHFRQPPDFRLPGRGSGQNVPNSNLTIPSLRFPQWHRCSRCGRLEPLYLSERSKKECPACKSDGKYGILTQVSIVAMCEKGHLQDFPWREWVHREVNPSCQQDLRLVATGSATLAGQKVKCGCGVERSLSGVTYENVLSKSLDKDNSYLCQGQKPWLGSEEREQCDLAPRAALRSASNVYYAHTASAIFVPRGGSDVPAELLTCLESPALSLLINQVGFLLTPQLLRTGKPEIAEMVAPFTDEQVRKGIEQVLSQHSTKKSEPKKDEDFKREEYNVLRTDHKEDELKIRSYDIAEYANYIGEFFSRITLIDKLRETRALYGFTRILPENDQSLKDLKAMLRRKSSSASWLPAYLVYGEGIFLEFNEETLQAWLEANRAALKTRLQPVIQRNAAKRAERGLKEQPLSARFFLLHTFAHVLIRRLTFECGYSAASLRERLYISDDPEAPMAAVLIYTASGDAEGTMGGLVRMGKPGLLEPVIKKAVYGARWCSSDPVCMELGAEPRAAHDNLAACHSCALLPETSCEEFNRFLDRAVLVGDFQNSSLGFFNSSASRNS